MILRDDATDLHFRVLYASLILVASLIVGSSIAQVSSETTDIEFQEALLDEQVDPPTNNGGMALLLVAIWQLPIYSFFFLPWKEAPPSYPTDEEGVESPSDGTTRAVNEDGDDRISLLEASNREKVQTGRNEADRVDETPELEPWHSDELESGVVQDKNLLEMLCSRSAILMLWTTTILVGAGTLESNNMDKMVAALRFHPEVTPSSLAIFSVAQAAARVVTGGLSENAAHWTSVHVCLGREVGGIPRPFFLVMASVVGLFAHVTLAIASSQNMFLTGVALSGAAFGMVWPLMVLITGEVFGPNNIGANYMFFDGFTSAAGTFLLSKVIAQGVYEEHTVDDEALMCYGADCYRTTHWIVAGLIVSCIVTSVVLLFITNPIYRRKFVASRAHHAHEH